MERTISLAFRCCGCDQPLSVTVRCRGPEPRAQDPEAPIRCAQANVSCPDCGQLNQLLFEPTGQLHCVWPLTSCQAMPAPSLN